MTFRLIHSTYTSRLVDDLVGSLAGAADPGQIIPVLLPSRPLVERVRVALARQAGIAMGVEFLLPAAFVDRLSLQLGMEPMNACWSKEGLSWRILSLLEKRKLHPRLGKACKDPQALVALALQVADRFDQYLHFRPDMIAAWDADSNWGGLLNTGTEEDEQWQRALWKDLRAGMPDPVDPVMGLKRLLAKTAQAGATKSLPPIEVLSTGPLPGSLMQLLAALGRFRAVNLRLLLPSANYLSGLRSSYQQRKDKQMADLDVEGHPLLPRLGTQAIATFDAWMGLNADEVDIDLDEGLPEPEAATLLGQLQADIRATRQPDPANCPIAEAPLRSLRVHRCHGPRREVEVLRDELLQAFEDMPGLQAKDILILAPDLKVYGPLVQAHLPGKSPRLPLRMAERTQDLGDGILQALKAMLAMTGGRMPLSEGLALLEQPALLAQLGEDAVNGLAEKLPASGITFGLDQEHRARLKAGSDREGTWAHGLDRLAAGLWLGPEPLAADRDDKAVLPLAGDLGGGRKAQSLALDWMSGVLATMRAWQASPASPAGWADRLQAAVGQHLDKAMEALGSESLPELLASLRGAELEHGCTVRLDAAAIIHWLEDEGLDEVRKVPSVGGAIALGGLKPLRALPCRVLAILGLHDAVFPRHSHAPAWDLLAAAPQAGDRDPRLEDRQLLLDALMAARDRVILTAPVRNVRSNKDEPLSASVEVLLRTAQDTAATDAAGRKAWREKLVKDHSLQPFNPTNFQGAEASYDKDACELAQTLALPRSEEPFFAGDVEAPAEDGLPDPDLDQVLSFLRDPATGCLRALGLTPPRMAEEGGDEDQEPMELSDSLHKWKLADAALQAGLSGQERFLEERLSAERLLPYGRYGRSLAAKKLGEGRKVAVAVLGLAGGQPQVRTMSADLGSHRLDGQLALDATGKHLMAWTAGKLSSASTRLKARVTACLAAASGLSLPTLVAGNGEHRLDEYLLPAVGAEEARKELAGLVALYHAGRRRPLAFSTKLSFEIWEAWARASKKTANDADAVGAARAAAQDAWDKDETGAPGEGQKPAMALLWKGQEPLSAEGFPQWLSLARQVYEPVEKWWAMKAKPGGEAQ
jgi:exodeoxyribonuclease V gamma subunit